MDTTKKAAKVASKGNEQFRIEEFRNSDDGYSAVLVDNVSGSLTLQANASSAAEARKKLDKAVEDGNLVFLDPGIWPASEQTDFSDLDGNERRNAARTNARNNDEARRVVNGYEVLNSDREEPKASKSDVRTETPQRLASGTPTDAQIKAEKK